MWEQVGLVDGTLVDRCGIDGTIGDKCGAAFIDQRFRKWMEEKLGREAVEKIPAAKLREGSTIARDFEAAKMSFDGTRTEHYLLRIPREAGIDDDPKNGIEDGELLMTQ